MIEYVMWNGYQVYPDGRFYRDGVLKKTRVRNGVTTIHVKLGRDAYTIPLARALAMAFIPNPNNLPYVIHKDGDKRNDMLHNLAWSSTKHPFVRATQVYVCRDIDGKLVGVYPTRQSVVNATDISTIAMDRMKEDPEYYKDGVRVEVAKNCFPFDVAWCLMKSYQIPVVSTTNMIYFYENECITSKDCDSLEDPVEVDAIPVCDIDGLWRIQT